MKFNYLFLGILLSVSVFVAGCTSTPTITGTSNVNGDPIPTITNSSEVIKVEIIHFHRTYQCYSCITMGAYAEETVNTYFADEVASGKVSFAHLNAELPENQELVNKYGVTGASLWLGVYTDGGNFSAEQNIDVWFKIDDKESYMDYLKGVIEQKLAGN